LLSATGAGGASGGVEEAVGFSEEAEYDGGRAGLELLRLGWTEPAASAYQA